MRRAICLRDEEAAAQVGVEHQVPIVPGDVERGLAHVAAGVVDQDVDLPEGGFDLRAPCCSMLAWSRTSSASGCARAAERFDLGDEWRKVVSVCGW